jgi:hypothetical protein
MHLVRDLKLTNYLDSFQQKPTNQKENITPMTQNHSQGLSVFLAQLAGAYETENKASRQVTSQT